MSSIVQSSSYDPFILLEKRMQRLINEGNFDAAVSECGMYIKTLENFKSTFVAAGLIETARTANTGAAVVGLSPAVVQQALLLSQGIASEHENRPGPTLSFDSMAKLGVVGAQAIATATSMAVCAGMWCLNSRVNPDAPTDFSELYSQLQTTALTAGVASAATFSAAALDVLIQRVIKLSNKIHKERAEQEIFVDNLYLSTPEMAEKEKSKIRKEMAKLAGSKTSEALQKRIYYTALLGQWDDMARLVALARKSNIPMPEELNSIDGVHLLHKLQMPMHKLFDFIELINLTPPKYVYEKMELTPQEMLEVLIRDVALRKYTKIMQDTAIKHVVGASGFSRDVRLFEQYFKCNGMAALRTRAKQALSDDRDPLHEVYKGYQAREALKLLKTSGLKLFSDILKELNVSLPDTAKKELYETEFLTAMANFATTDVRNFEFLMKKGNLQKVAAQASAMGTFDAHNLPKEHDFMELMTAVKEGRKLEKKLKFGKKG